MFISPNIFCAEVLLNLMTLDNKIFNLVNKKEKKNLFYT